MRGLRAGIAFLFSKIRDNGVHGVFSCGWMPGGGRHGFLPRHTAGEGTFRIVCSAVRLPDPGSKPAAPQASEGSEPLPGSGLSEALIGSGLSEALIGSGLSEALIGSGLSDALIGSGLSEALIGSGLSEALIGSGLSDASIE